jgi:hypothetical protein
MVLYSQTQNFTFKIDRFTYDLAECRQTETNVTYCPSEGQLSRFYVGNQPEAWVFGTQIYGHYGSCFALNYKDRTVGLSRSHRRHQYEDV